jgi:uncharacterized membrane protein HdeD (DUF308 family)
MIELFLILLGGRAVRKKWWLVGLIGLVWASLGAFIFVNALIDEFRMRPSYFAIPLAIDGALSLIAALGSEGGVRMLRFGKAAVETVLALVIMLYPYHGGIVIGFLVGTFLVADATWRAASALVVRYATWRRSCVYAGIEFVLGLWSFVPWPTNWQGEVGADVGQLLVISALEICALALRIRKLPADRSIAGMLTRGWPVDASDGAALGNASSPVPPTAPSVVTVHVWTPTGQLAPINRGVSRYVAAFNEDGVVSTGHAALEAPGLYISHYPAVELDRSDGDFRRSLRATQDNDVPGRFLPSYEAEVAEWRGSTRQVQLKGLDMASLAAFWAAYRADSTYNLTNRNCSSGVAKALDAGLEGIFAAPARSMSFSARLFLAPELWVAGFMRHRAAAMAWTPGLVLDYARALSVVIALPTRLAKRGRRAAWGRANK